MSVFGIALGGVVFLAIAAFLIAGYVVLVEQAVVESRWAFTNVSTERICGAEQTRDCLLRLPGRVASVNGLEFSATLDQAPYRLDVSTLRGDVPAAGSRIVIEKWNGRLVSVVDPKHGRRHAEEWPRKWHDLAEGGTAMLFVLGIPGLIGWGWIVGRRKDTEAITALPAQTS